jgi:hypothetical protein
VRDRGATSSSWGATWENFARKAIVKFASFRDWREVARLELPKGKCYMHDPGPLMALNTSSDRPVIWFTHFNRRVGREFIWKIVDRGAALERVPHKMVLHRRYGSGPPTMGADRARNVLIAGRTLIDPATGEMTPLELQGEAGKAALKRIGDIRVAPDGLRYFRSAESLPKYEKAWRIRRFDGAGKLVPFAGGREYLEANAGRAATPFNSKYTFFDVGPDGRVYVVSMVSRKDRTMRVDVYGRDGTLARAGLIAMTRSGGCVRVDRFGRIYASDSIRPKGLRIPACYDSDPLGQHARWYGTVLRYGPDGGGVRPAKKEQATHLAGGKQRKLVPVRVEGALWGFYGMSPLPLQTGCICTAFGTAFDVDGWGRLWVPDAPGFCVAAVDPAGNVITRFGAYGNRDATGAGGAVPAPPIPLWHPFDAAALDGDVFVRDRLALRLVQVRLTYAAEASAPVR